MSDRIEQTMKKIHIYLANCKQSAYSSEDLIVSKTRLFSLLEELSYAVYEAKEEYEVTEAARNRGIAKAERVAAEIKEEAMQRADDIHASSILYTQEGITSIKNILEHSYEKIRAEYETVLTSCEEQLRNLEKDSMELVSQLELKADAKVYLQMIENVKAKKRITVEELQEKHEVASKKIGNAAASTETYGGTQQDEYESKLSSAIVVEVHDTPKAPEGFGRSKKKKKKKGSGSASTQVTSQELDAEYFAFQEEQQKALEEQVSLELDGYDLDQADKGAETMLDVLKKLPFGKKK